MLPSAGFPCPLSYALPTLHVMHIFVLLGNILRSTGNNALNGSRPTPISRYMGCPTETGSYLFDLLLHLFLNYFLPEFTVTYRLDALLPLNLDVFWQCLPYLPVNVRSLCLELAVLTYMQIKVSFVFIEFSCQSEGLQVLLAVLISRSKCFGSVVYLLQPLNFLLYLRNIFI